MIVSYWLGRHVRLQWPWSSTSLGVGVGVAGHGNNQGWEVLGSRDRGRCKYAPVFGSFCAESFKTRPGAAPAGANSLWTADQRLDVQPTPV
jgi:hypothetical protein